MLKEKLSPSGAVHIYMTLIGESKESSQSTDILR